MIRCKHHTIIIRKWNSGVINIMINFYKLQIGGVVTFYSYMYIK